ncbi:hypothetical protein ACQWCX_24420, partial [Salmonella enterica subsp. enterica serovar Infantis]
RHEIDEVVDLDGDHVRISVFPVGFSRIAMQRTVLPTPVLLTGLIGTLSEKTLGCPLPEASLSMVAIICRQTMQRAGSI